MRCRNDRRSEPRRAACGGRALDPDGTAHDRNVRRCDAFAARLRGPVRNRRRGAPPALPLPRRHLRRRSRVRQHRGMVAGHPRGDPPAQGPALLPPPRRERGERLHRLREPAEPGARGTPGARASPGGAAALRQVRERPLHPPVVDPELGPQQPGLEQGQAPG